MPDGKDAVQTRQRTERVAETTTPLQAAGSYESSTRLVAGYSVVALLALSDQPFTLMVSEASESDGEYGVTNPFTAELEAVSGLYMVCQRVRPCGTYLKTVLTNTGADMASLEYAATAIPVVGGGAGGGGGAGENVSISTDGTAGDVFEEALVNSSDTGFVGIGTIKNLDPVNSITVRETVTDAFGVTDSVETVVSPADEDYLLDPQTNFGNARPFYTEYIVEVKSTIPGSPAAWELRYTSQGDLS